MTPIEPCEELGLPVVDRIPPTPRGSLSLRIGVVGRRRARKEDNGDADSLTAPNAAYHRVTPRSFAKDKLAREIKSYLIEAGDRPINVTDLCERFKIPRRTLHCVFIDVVGTPSITYLRRKRLDGVRAAFLTAVIGATVGYIARVHGFTQLGRFATAYRRQFGEKPSQTLRNR